MLNIEIKIDGHTTNVNLKTYYNYIKYIKNNNKPFYASDFNLCSGEINSLARWGLIAETGNKKECFILVDDYRELYKKVYAKEWIVTNESTTPKKTTEWCYDWEHEKKAFLEKIDNLFEAVEYLKTLD